MTEIIVTDSTLQTEQSHEADGAHGSEGAIPAGKSRYDILDLFELLWVKTQALIFTGLDESTIPHSRRFLIQVEPTLQSLQSQEDTDGNMQITIEDNGPKVG